MAGARHGIGVTSGTDAILLALMALDIGPGDEVLCPSFTFFATAGCIARTGAIPVFVDAEPASFNLDVADAARKVSPKTKAVIPVHLFGQSADMDAVMALADEHGLAVIEDAAQSLGAAYRDRPLGGIGTFGTFSFFPSKNLGGFGDSGMLVANDDELSEKARILRTHGSKPKYYHKYVGGNFRMDPLQAALLQVKLPHYPDYTERRRANAAFYTEHLARLPGVAMNNGRVDETSAAAILLPQANGDCRHIWNQYTLRVPGNGRRDALRAHLAERGIGSEIYYPVPMHRQECFREFYRGDALPVSEYLAAEAISIPVFPEITEDQRGAVVEAIKDFLVAER